MIFTGWIAERSGSSPGFASLVSPARYAMTIWGVDHQFTISRSIVSTLNERSLAFARMTGSSGTRYAGGVLVGASSLTYNTTTGVLEHANTFWPAGVVRDTGR